MDFDKEMEKKFDELFWYVLNEQTHQLNKEKEYMESLCIFDIIFLHTQNGSKKSIIFLKGERHSKNK